MTDRDREAPRCTSPFWSLAEHNPVVAQAIAERLRRQGRLTFAEFMDLALYLPEAGYYAAAGASPGRDYRTSPRVHPVFGALLALQFEQMWRALGSPGRFTVLEAGAGDGLLCREVLDFIAHLEPAFASALDYVIVEPHPAALVKQRAMPAAGNVDRVRWIRGSALALPVRALVGCVVSNELADAFPVHRVVMKEGVLHESYVVATERGLGDMLGAPSTPELGRYFARIGLQPPEGCVVEVCLAAARFIGEAAAALDRGFVLTVDYGYPAEELYSPRRPAGTLRCYHRHRFADDPYRALGRQDITAHVDFSTLVVAGREAGLRVAGLTTQRDFLLDLGLEAFVRQLEEGELPAGRRYDNKFAVQDLISAAGLGVFRVLAQHKGVHDPELAGFNPCSDLKRELVTHRRTPRWPVTEAAYPELGWDHM